MKLYYLTPTRNVPSILRKGLIAGKSRGLTEYLYGDIGKGFQSAAKAEKETLYFTEDLESMGELVSIMAYKVSKPTRFTVLEVSLPEDYVVEPDERQFGGGVGSLGGFLRSNVARIPTSRIRVLGTAMIRPKRETTYSIEAEELLRLGERSSEIAGRLEEPESVEEEQEILEEIKKLPAYSRAHKVIEEREKKMEHLKKLFEKTVGESEQ